MPGYRLILANFSISLHPAPHHGLKLPKSPIVIQPHQRYNFILTVFHVSSSPTSPELLQLLSELPLSLLALFWRDADRGEHVAGRRRLATVHHLWHVLVWCRPRPGTAAAAAAATASGGVVGVVEGEKVPTATLGRHDVQDGFFQTVEWTE